MIDFMTAPGHLLLLQRLNKETGESQDSQFCLLIALIGCISQLGIPSLMTFLYDLWQSRFQSSQRVWFFSLRFRMGIDFDHLSTKGVASGFTLWPVCAEKRERPFLMLRNDIKALGFLLEIMYFKLW